MNLKKKLSMVAAMAMCVTVGGVYAQWIYSEGAASSRTINKTITLTGESISSPKGTIDVSTDNLIIKIDDTDNDHYGELVAEGSVWVTFTPASSGVDDDTLTNGIVMSASFSLLNNFTYDFTNNTAGSGDQVFTIMNGGVMTATGKSFSWEIKAKDVLTYLGLTDDGAHDSVVYLPTLDDYNAFHNAINEELVITVTDVTP